MVTSKGSRDRDLLSNEPFHQPSVGLVEVSLYNGALPITPSRVLAMS